VFVCIFARNFLQPFYFTNQEKMSASETLQSTGAVPVPNLGNPLFSCVGKVEPLPSSSDGNSFYKAHHPLYQTSASNYGELMPSSDTAPSTFHGKSQRFSQHLGVCGMYRNHSLNTSMDKSKVYDHPRMWMCYKYFSQINCSVVYNNDTA